MMESLFIEARAGRSGSPPQEERRVRAGVNTKVAPLLLIAHPAHRVADQLRAILKPKLLLDMRPVGFDGLDAEMKLGRNLAGLPAVANELKHLQLPVAELGHARAGGNRFAVQKFL